MIVENETFRQSILIDNFNEFVRQAQHRGISKISEINDKGCCFALSLYNLKQAHEGPQGLNQFYDFYSFVTTYFTPTTIAELLEKTKLSESQKTPYLENGKDPPPFNDIEINIPPYKSFKFSKLIDFIQGIGRAQKGYKSKVSMGRYAATDKSMGLFESISGNFENNYPIYCNINNITKYLEGMRIMDNHYVLISTGNHAINLRRTADNHFLVYDSNNKQKPKILKSLSEVGEVILQSFARVDVLSQQKEAALVFQSVSFLRNEVEVREAVQQYRYSLMHSRPEGVLSNDCHDIILHHHSNGEDVMGMALDIFDLYSQEKKLKKTTSIICILLLKYYLQLCRTSLENVLTAFDMQHLMMLLEQKG